MAGEGHRTEDAAIPQGQNPAQSPPDAVPPLQELWPKLLTEIRSKRPLILSWLEKAVPLGVEGGVFRLGFPEDQTLTLESLMRANNRKFIEATVSGLLGQPYRLEAEIRPVPMELACQPDPRLLRAAFRQRQCWHDHARAAGRQRHPTVHRADS